MAMISSHNWIIEQHPTGLGFAVNVASNRDYELSSLFLGVSLKTEGFPYREKALVR
jgi:hypothetical protein